MQLCKEKKKLICESVSGTNFNKFFKSSSVSFAAPYVTIMASGLKTYYKRLLQYIINDISGPPVFASVHTRGKRLVKCT